MTPDRSVRIDRLSVRVRGVPAATAREAAAGLGADLAGRLADSLPVGATRDVAIGDLALRPVRLPSGAGAAGVRSAVVAEVAGAIVRRVSEKGR
jgi:hypothetical protein